MEEDKSEQLDALGEEVRNLEKSPLYQYRQNHHYQAVIGEGDPYAEILFIGEAPGKQDGKPGPAYG
ncbi:MAG: hypothetical protein P8074_15970 [Anaerolineales bacterium]